MWMNISGSCRMMGRALSLGLCLAVVLCGSCGCGGYKSRTWIEDAYCVHNEREAYIVIKTARSVQQDGFSALIRGAAGLYPERRSIQRVGSRLTLVHIKDRRVEQYNLEGSGVSGGCDAPFFFKGELYIARSGGKPGAGSEFHQWVGTNLVDLGQDGTQAIRNQFRDEEELMRREGWGQLSPCFNEGAYSYPFSIGENKYALNLKQDAGFYDATRSVSLTEQNTRKETPLLSVDQKLKSLDKDEFEKLRRAGPNN